MNILEKIRNGITYVDGGAGTLLQSWGLEAGVSPEIQKACSDGLLIPMSGRAESLNAGVAASIFAWEMSR